MSALEFEEWKAYIKHEELHPSAQRQRHAQLLAAAHQGPLTRRSRKPWVAADFMSSDAWAVPVPTEGTSRVSAAKQIQAMSRRGRR